MIAIAVTTGYLITSPVAASANGDDIILDSLFTSLQEVTDAGDVARITSEIWSRWSTHPDDDTLILPRHWKLNHVILARFLVWQ